MSNVPTPQNINNLIPPPPTGRKNVIFQADDNNPRNVSAYTDGATLGGITVITATSYTLTQADTGTLLVFTNNSPITVSLDSSLPANFFATVLFLGAAGGTLTPTSGLVNGAASVSVSQGTGGWLFFDGTNWYFIQGSSTAIGAASIVSVQNEGYTYTVDSGSANAYAATLSPAVTAYVAGLDVAFKASNTNTTASTLNVNGLGAKTIKKWTSGSEVDLTAGDITTGQIIRVKYDGTNFQMISGSGGSGSTGNGISYAVDTGATNAYVMAPTPAVTSYTAGLAIAFKAANANTGPSTVNVSSLGTKNITKLGTMALQGGEILAGQIIFCIYDGVQFQMVDAQDRPDRLASFLPGLPNAGQSVMGYAVAWPLTFPANFASPQSYGHCDTNPTATAVYTIYKNGSNVGTITISTSGIFTFATTGGVSFSCNPNDFIEVVAPGSQDATLANVGFTLVGTRTAAVPQTVGQGIFVYRGAWSGATAYNANDVVNYFGQVYICILPNTGNAPTNATYWLLALPNMYGGAITLDYLFSTTTTNSDPGSGNLRLNNATQNTATAFYVNNTDANGSALSALLDTLDASTNTVKAKLRFVVKGDITKWLNFDLISRTNHTGYHEFAITNVASSASSPFGNGDELLVDVSIIGDAGGGATGTQIQNHAFTYVADSGSANAYVVTPSPAVTSYVGGLGLEVKIANTNTGASTINVSSLGTKNIKKYQNGSLVNPGAGDLTAGNICPIIYDGTQFLLVGGGGDNSAKYILGDVDTALTNAVKDSTIYQSIDVSPSSANSMDDEFDDTSGMSGTNNGLNARWTWFNQGSATISYGHSCGSILAPGNTQEGRGIMQNVPGSTPWQFTVRFSVNGANANQWGGILLWDTVANRNYNFIFGGQYTPSVGQFTGSGGTIPDQTFSSWGFGGGTSGWPFNKMAVYYRIKDDGTNLFFSMSFDGVTFDLLFNPLRAAWLTNTANKIGILVNGWAGTTPRPTTNCDWFRRDI